MIKTDNTCKTSYKTNIVRKQNVHTLQYELGCLPVFDGQGGVVASELGDVIFNAT